MRVVSLLVLTVLSLNAQNVQDSLFWFDMNTVLDPMPKTPKILDDIYGTSQLKMYDSLYNVKTTSEVGFRLQIFETTSVDEAYAFVNDLKLTNLQLNIAGEVLKEIRLRLSFLRNVGLGYLSLNRESGTLSGGEAQRIKLSSELSKRPTGHTIYILDEPTTGLHFEDIRRLLAVLSRLVDQGNTVVVIEHNLDVIKTADWIIDMGPEGGDGGGLVIASGTPEKVAETPESHTGRFLAPLLAR